MELRVPKRPVDTCVLYSNGALHLLKKMLPVCQGSASKRNDLYTSDCISNTKTQKPDPGEITC